MLVDAAMRIAGLRIIDLGDGDWLFVLFIRFCALFVASALGWLTCIDQLRNGLQFH